MAYTPTIDIHWMLSEHLPAIEYIDQRAAETPGFVPWTGEDFTRHLRCKNAIALVAIVRPEVLGYVVYRLEKRRIVIERIAIDPTAQRRRIAASLIQRLTSKLFSARRYQLVASVHERNLVGQLFCRACGFRCVRTVRLHDDSDCLYEFVYTHGESESHVF